MVRLASRAGAGGGFGNGRARRHTHSAAPGGGCARAHARRKPYWVARNIASRGVLGVVAARQLHNARAYEGGATGVPRGRGEGDCRTPWARWIAAAAAAAAANGAHSTVGPRRVRGSSHRLWRLVGSASEVVERSMKLGEALVRPAHTPVRICRADLRIAGPLESTAERAAVLACQT